MSQEEKASETANSLWERFKASLEEGIEKFIPHRIAGKKDSHPWITPESKKLIRKRNKLYITKRNYPSRQNINHYKESRRLVQKKFHKAYWDYVNEIVSPDKSDHGNKKFWSYIKHCKNDSVGVAPLLDNKTGVTPSDSRIKATLLNRQFQDAFSPKIPMKLKHLCLQNLRTNQSAETPHEFQRK